MSAHIDIAGCSAEGAALCYRTLCLEGAQYLGSDYAHPEVSMHTPSLRTYVDCLERGDVDGIAALMLASAQVLANAGADFLICPDNTIHQALPLVLPRSPLPWLSIADVVAQEAAARSYRKVVIAGTHWLMESDIYPNALRSQGIQCHVPEPAERHRIHQIIMDELVHGRMEAPARNFFKSTMDGWRQNGCEATALVCTELPLLLENDTCPLPALDSTRLLAHAASAEFLPRTAAIGRGWCRGDRSRQPSRIARKRKWRLPSGVLQ